MLLLPRIGLGLTGLWLTYPVSDVLSAIITIIFFRREMKQLDKLAEKQEEIKEQKAANLELTPNTASD